jgi:multidrug efflux pump subunit AcrA (membrane-fusion protein)
MNQTTSPAPRSPMTVALGILVAILLGTTVHFASKSSSLSERELAAAEASKLAQTESDRAAKAEADAKSLAERTARAEAAATDAQARAESAQAAAKEARAKLQDAQAQAAARAAEADAARASLERATQDLAAARAASGPESDADTLRGQVAQLKAALAETRGQLERAQSDLASRGSASAATAGGPSPFWSGKPWYGTLDLEAMMRWYRRPEKPEDVQVVEFREAKAELERRAGGR